MMSVLALLVIVLVTLSFTGLFFLALRRKSWLLLCVFLFGVGLLARLVWTSGIRPDDWVEGVIYSEGKNTVVVVDGCELVLENAPWPEDTRRFRMQVAGWTRSASAPASEVYVTYLGGGESEIVVNQRSLKLRNAATEILVGDAFVPLQPGERLLLPSERAE